MSDIELSEDMLFEEGDAWGGQQLDTASASEHNSNEEYELPEGEQDNSFEVTPRETSDGTEATQPTNGLRLPSQYPGTRLRTSQQQRSIYASSAPVNLPQLYRWQSKEESESTSPVPTNTFVPLHTEVTAPEELFGTSYDKRPLLRFAQREKVLRAIGWYDNNPRLPYPSSVNPSALIPPPVAAAGAKS